MRRQQRAFLPLRRATAAARRHEMLHTPPRGCRARAPPRLRRHHAIIGSAERKRAAARAAAAPRQPRADMMSVSHANGSRGQTRTMPRRARPPRHVRLLTTPRMRARLQDIGDCQR